LRSQTRAHEETRAADRTLLEQKDKLIDMLQKKSSDSLVLPEADCRKAEIIFNQPSAPVPSD
jgi:hypothetical protein